MSEDISPELVNIYLEDARGHLEALEHCLLTLEREGFDAEVIASVLGPLHTLKGNSGMMGFGGIKDYVHRLEDAFAQVSEGALKLTPTVFDLLFSGASALREGVEKACEAGREARSLESEKNDLESLIAQAAHHAPAAPHLPSVTPPIGVAPVAGPPAPGPPRAPSPKKAAELQYVAARSSMLRVDFAQLD